jgi:hypothetical protein
MSTITILTKVASKAITAAAYSLLGMATANRNKTAITVTKIAITTIAHTLIEADRVIHSATSFRDAITRRKNEILASSKERK